MKVADLKRLDDNEARRLLEFARWPHGPVCPRCGNVDQERIGRVKANPAKGVRAGLYQCKECRRQFTVTVGTVMERSKLPLSTWVYVIASMCNAKKGVSAKQLQRELKAQTKSGGYGNYQSMWFACHRVRHAMREPSHMAKMGLLNTHVAADETYVGGKPRYNHVRTVKVPVVALVEKGGGARAVVLQRVTKDSVRKFVLDNVHKSTTLVTDESALYKGLDRKFKAHKTVLHSAGEYVRLEEFNRVVTSNEAESFFALLKRSVYGTFHSVSPEHLQRYVDELTLKWSTRTMADVDRTMLVMKKSEGKRLTYTQTKGSNIAPEVPPV